MGSVLNYRNQYAWKNESKYSYVILEGDEASVGTCCWKTYAVYFGISLDICTGALSWIPMMNEIFLKKTVFLTTYNA